jgi:fermentation-respiration switch protein FrsA (DUF1100 family)
MIELFPGNYAWSQAALRAMFVGGSPGEVLWAVEILSSDPAADGERWHQVWRGLGDQMAERAVQARGKGHLLTAASSWRRASIYLQWSVAFLPVADARRPEGYRRSVELFAAHAELSSPPIERVEVPYLDASFPAWLVRPAGDGAMPCAIFLPGWDSTKEQGIGLAQALAERGIATLLCDGPGIGEAVLFRGMPNRHDYEVPGRAAFDHLLEDPRVDPSRIAVIGSSLGGYRAARFASFEQRLAATVIWGAIWDFGRTWQRQMERPGSSLPTNADHALHVMGASTLDEVSDLLSRWTLDGVAHGISSPLLVLHGEADSQIPVEDAQRVYETARSTTKTLRVFPTGESGSAHCQNDNRILAHEEIGDWLAEVLRA